MPSPLAHAGAALALHLVLAPTSLPLDRRVAAAAAVASVLPDADIALAATLPGGLDWHRGPTHSLLGAAALGGLVAAAAGLRGWRAWSTVVGAALLHVPFDWSTGEPGAPVRYGVLWAWPFSDAKSIDASPWFGAFRIDEAGFLKNMWASTALPVYLRELGTTAALLAFGQLTRWLRGRRAAG